MPLYKLTLNPNFKQDAYNYMILFNHPFSLCPRAQEFASKCCSATGVQLGNFCTYIQDNLSSCNWGWGSLTFPTITVITTTAKQKGENSVSLMELKSVS